MLAPGMMDLHLNTTSGALLANCDKGLCGCDLQTNYCLHAEIYFATQS